MDDTTPQVDTTPDYTTPPKRPQKSIFIIIGAVVIALAAYLFFSFSPPESDFHTSQDYLINGVPYYGIYTYQGGDGRSIADTIEASVAMVIAYWNPEQANEFPGFLGDLRETAREGTFYGLDRVADFVDDRQYHAEIVSLSLNELSRYINNERRTPLIGLVEVAPDEPLPNPVGVVVVGISSADNTVTVHDYWLGNNREIPFDDYLALTGADSPSVAVEYLVIEPENLDEALVEVTARSEAAYPARIEVMDVTEHAFIHYYLGAAATFAGNYSYAIDQLNELRSDPVYDEYFPAYFKVYANTFLAQSYLGQGDLVTALNFAETAVALNDSLDQPAAGGWPGVQSVYNAPEFVDQSYYPHVILGDVYKADDDIVSARAAYEQAVTISGDSVYTRARLSSLEEAS